MNNIYKNIEEYSPNEKRKILIVFDDMIADMLSNEKPISVVTELFMGNRKLNMSLDFMTQTHFKVKKDVRLNTTHFLLWKFQTSKNLDIINH